MVARKNGNRSKILQLKFINSSSAVDSVTNREEYWATIIRERTNALMGIPNPPKQKLSLSELRNLAQRKSETKRQSNGKPALKKLEVNLMHLLNMLLGKMPRKLI